MTEAAALALVEAILTALPGLVSGVEKLVQDLKSPSTSTTPLAPQATADMADLKAQLDAAK